MTNPDDLSVREILKLSQTDVTHDAMTRHDYAVQAWSVASTPEVMLSDPNAAGEAAAKAAFNAAVANLPVHDVEEWFTRSYASLPRDEWTSARERIATHILEGRALGFLALKNNSNYLEDKADTSFKNGTGILDEQHVSGKSWDPYATMASAHWASFEAVRWNGSAPKAVAIASVGIWRAISSRREEANSPISLIKHGASIVKHVGMNAVAGTLAATKVFDSIKPVAKVRKSMAIKMLGGA